MRDQELLKVRPPLKNATINDQMCADERFQNQTIRPVIKLQNELLIAVFQNYVNKHKGVFYELPIPRQLEYIDTVLHKDMKFRNSVKGMIIGQFTIQEYELYIQNSSALNKRMMNLVVERLKDQLQCFQLSEKLSVVS